MAAKRFLDWQALQAADVKRSPVAAAADTAADAAPAAAVAAEAAALAPADAALEPAAWHMTKSERLAC
jgi:hypothetical protein